MVALRQPIRTEEVSAVRGLDSGATLKTLHKRKMIAKTREPSVAEGALWRTTQNFLDLFGLASLDDLYQGGQLERVFGPAYGTPVLGQAAAPRNGTSGQHAPELS